VISLVETSGRIDQIMANINTLFKSRQILSCPVFQLACNSLSWLLWPGHHQIAIPSNLQNKVCSLVPIGSPAKCVSSTGLKWDLGKMMQFLWRNKTFNFCIYFNFRQARNGIRRIDQHFQQLQPD